MANPKYKIVYKISVEEITAFKVVEVKGGHKIELINTVSISQYTGSCSEVQAILSKDR